MTHDFTWSRPTFHAFLDMVRKSTFRACRRILLTDGSRPVAPRGGSRRTSRSRSPLASAGDDRGRVVFLPIVAPEILEHLRSVWSSAFRPVIDRRYPLEDIVEAYRYVEGGRKVGNFIFTGPDRLTPAASPPSPARPAWPMDTPARIGLVGGHDAPATGVPPVANGGGMAATKALSRHGFVGERASQGAV